MHVYLTKVFVFVCALCEQNSAKEIQCDIQARIISVGLAMSEPIVEGRFPRKVILFAVSRGGHK